jgi:2-methylcitrate dehydratase PrpD
VTAPAGVVAVLAERACTLRETEGDRIRPAARDAFVDWLAVALGGSTRPITTALLEGLGPGDGPSRVVGRGVRLPTPVAALVNGAAAHVLELDDIYAPGLFHPGAPVVAAALAVAEQRNATFGRLLRAVVVGYEVGCRLAVDLGPSHYAHWHTTGTAGAVAAAAAAADLRDAGATTFAHALSLAATMAGGVQQTFRSDAAGKPLHAGGAAQAGVVAAAAAAGGVTGAADVLEGPAGFAAATGTATDWAACQDGAERRLAIEQVTVKPFACCGHAFAPIDGAARLRAAGVATADVGEIVVETYATAIATAGIAEPRTPAERNFSIPFLVAAALAQGTERMFTAHAANDPVVRRLTARVRLVPDAAFDARFPARRGARVTAVLADGQRRAVEVPDRPGSPERPLGSDQLAEKFVATAAAVLGDRARAAHAALLALDAATPVRSLELGP